MNIKMFDSELKVMEILWREGDIPAKEIAALLAKAADSTLVYALFWRLGG
mgnify:CR=1 FL=1